MKSFEFDPNQFAAVAGAAVVPPGHYQAVITDVMEKRARSGDGTYTQFAFRISRGDHAGRIVWVRLHLGSSDEHIKRLAQQELAAMCMAIGVPKLTSWDQLVDRCVQITVGIKRREDGDLASVVRAYATCASPVVKARGKSAS